MKRIFIGVVLAAGIFSVALAGCSSSDSEATSVAVSSGNFQDSTENPGDPTAFSGGSTYDDPEFQRQREAKAGQSALQGISRGNLWNGFSPLINTTKILSGGPPPDGIPSIDSPNFLTVENVDFLDDEEPVISLNINGTARAYPVQILTWHEIVNDVVAGVPVTVTYCPLCNSAVAYNRQLGDPSKSQSELLDFGTSGFLFNSSLVMYDRQTETLWTHFDGRAVVGELEGLQLDFFPISIISWSAWRDANPGGMVLNRVFDSRGNPIRNYGQNPYSGYLDREELLGGFLNIRDVDDRLLPKELVIGVRSENEAVAIVRENLQEKGVIELEVDDAPITVWHISGTKSALDASLIADSRDIGTVVVFERELEGRALEFQRKDGRIIDKQTNSEWNVFGKAVSGELAGSQLKKIEFLDTFWFAWAGFNPETRILQ